MKFALKCFMAAVPLVFLSASLFLTSVFVGAAEFPKEKVLAPCSACHSERFLAGS